MSHDSPGQAFPPDGPGPYPPGGPNPPQPPGGPNPPYPPGVSNPNPPSPYGEATQPWATSNPLGAPQGYPTAAQPTPSDPSLPTQAYAPTPPQPLATGSGVSGGGGPAGSQPGSGGPGWRSRRVLIPLAVVVVLGLIAAGAFVFVKLRGVQAKDAPTGAPTPTGQAAQLPAGRTWLSGAWTGGGITAARIKSFGEWRGQQADVVTTYPAYQTWDELRNSEWHISTFDGYSGRLSYGLPLQPKDKSGSLSDVADGKYDDVWTSIASTLVKHKRGNTFVRIGLEANGTWFPWGATADRADKYKAAWRHVEKVMKASAPDLVFGFDITCGKALEGGSDRLDSLNKLYPGDDVVDVVGCDHYDSYTVKSRNESEWEKTLRPAAAAGLADVADFARQHGKKLVVPEWGLTSTAKDGAGDNSYFIYSMYGYFQQNKDILAYENYFNEPDDYLGSSIWSPVQNPKASAEYLKLWGQDPTLTTASSTGSSSS